MRPDTRRDHQERILRVLVHIQSHLDEELSLDELARQAAFSPFHFHRVFRGLVGEPLGEHVRRLRLERAASELRRGERSVTELALDAGYESLEAFTRAFRGRFAVTPSTFREEHRAVPVPEGLVPYVAGDGEPVLPPRPEGGPKMDVRIESVPARKVVFMRHVGPYGEVGATWQKLMGWAFPKGLVSGVPVTLGICHDDPNVTDPSKIRYDACLVVDRDVEVSGDVGLQEIPGGEYAVTTHEGPYEKLDGVWQGLLVDWLPASGREAAKTPCFEVYRNNPQTTPPEKLLTDVHVPLVAR